MSTPQKQWFSVEIVFNYREETKIFKFMNCNSKTVHNLRYQLMQEGIQIPTDPGVWIVIFPWNVISFTSYLQKSFYYALDSDEKRTVFTKEQSIN